MKERCCREEMTVAVTADFISFHKNDDRDLQRYGLDFHAPRELGKPTP